MRTICLLAGLCAALVLANRCAAGTSRGKVVLVRAIGDAPGAQSDVFEKDLDTGKTTLLISHKSLPKAFSGRIGHAWPSPSRRYMLLTGWWCWDRKTGTVRRVASEVGSSSQWAPRTDRLLIRDWGSESRQGSLWLYDPSTGRSRSMGSVRQLDLAGWSGHGDGIIVVTCREKGLSTVYFQPITGERKRLFTWNGPMEAVEQSPVGSHFAIFDGKRYWLTDARGRKPANLEIPAGEHGSSRFGVDFLFNRRGDKLALFTSDTYGEPHFGLMKRLWWVDVERKRPHLIAEWDESVRGGLEAPRPAGTAESRQVEGWLDDTSLVVSGRVIHWVGGDAEERSDWHKLWVYRAVSGAQGREVFDSGKRCLDAAWWPGLARK